MGSITVKSSVERKSVHKRVAGGGIGKQLTEAERRNIISKFVDLDGLTESGDIAIIGDIIAPLCVGVDEGEGCKG